ncbi:TPA: NifU family protein [bacterium]|jgi:Fe-S cluster biogenesis protein NfuA|nr:NifU family protein [bacterium]
MMTIEDQILSTLEKVRPFLQRDGGDVEFVKFEDGIVYLRLLGACSDCAFSNNTIKDGVEIILMEEVPGVERVEVVSA